MRVIRRSNRHHKRVGRYSPAIHSNDYHVSRRRDTSAIARASALPSMYISGGYTNPRTRSRNRVISQPLYQIEDGRSYNFNNRSFPRTITGAPASYHIPVSHPRPKQRRTNKYPSPVLSFTDNTRVIVCLRRKRRSEVLHAKGISGTRVAKPKNTSFTGIRC